MFRCELCGVNVGPRKAARHVVLEIRKKVYPFRPGANAPKLDEETGRKIRPDDAGGVGWETVKKAKACERCEGIYGSQPPKEIAA